MNTYMTQASSIVGVFLLGCSGAVAQSSADNTASAMAACTRIEPEVERLHCFDELARQIAGAAAPSSAPPGTTEPQLGTTQPAAAKMAPDTEPSGGSRREARAADRAQRELTSSVAAVREIQPGRIEVTLENGQVWRQTNSDRYDLLVGHEVKLYPTGFGRYFRLASTTLRGFIQVERVR
jgi:hypothetical protein